MTRWGMALTARATAEDTQVYTGFMLGASHCVIVCRETVLGRRGGRFGVESRENRIGVEEPNVEKRPYGGRASGCE